MRDARRRRAKRRALIFVHGFNNTFAEGLYRIAQLSHDLDLPRVTVHYSWPSAGQALGYVHDRDSALYARDGFEACSTRSWPPGRRRSSLSAIRWARSCWWNRCARWTSATPARCAAIWRPWSFCRPDIDVEVFRSQAVDLRQAAPAVPDLFVRQGQGAAPVVLHTGRARIAWAT